MNEHTKHLIDGASIMTAIATIAGWLPNIAALFTIIWLGMQMIIHFDKLIEKAAGAWKWFRE